MYVMEEKLIKNNTMSSSKDKITFFDKLGYPARYLQLRYNVSLFFVYLVFVFLVIGLILFIEMLNIF